MEIMIVDDEPQVAEVLAASLKRQGHSTTVVHSGREALDRLKSVAFDAMFLDVSMPGMNGLDVMAEVKRLRPSLAVVVITGHATPDEIARYFCGARLGPTRHKRETRCELQMSRP